MVGPLAGAPGLPSDRNGPLQQRHIQACWFSHKNAMGCGIDPSSSVSSSSTASPGRIPILCYQYLQGRTRKPDQPSARSITRNLPPPAQDLALWPAPACSTNCTASGMVISSDHLFMGDSHRAPAKICRWKRGHAPTAQHIAERTATKLVSLKLSRY